MTTTETIPGAPGPAATTAPKKFPRWRRWTAGFLIVLSCILVPLSVLGIWVRNQVLNTDRYVENVKPLASNPQIIDTVAAAVTDDLFARVNVEDIAKDVLPPRAAFLAAPLSAGLQTVVENAAVKVLSSPKFETVWIQANRVAHEQLRKALTDEGTYVSTTNGKVTLDLSAVFEQVKLGLKDRGISVFDRIPIDNLALRFELMDAKQLESAQQGTKLLNALSWALPVLSLLCLAGGLALSSNRRRSLMRWGIGMAFAVAVIGAGIAVGRGIYLDAVTTPRLPEATAAIVFDTLVRFLRYGVRVMIAIGLVVAFAAWVAGPSRLAERLRASGRAVVGGAGDMAGTHGVGFGAFGVWVSKHKNPLRVTAGLAVLVTLLLWTNPRGRTVLGLAIVFLLLFGIIEFIARASAVEAAAAEGHAVEASPPV